MLLFYMLFVGGGGAPRIGGGPTRDTHWSNLSLYIYIYICRERDVYIYIYIYRERCYLYE